LQCVFPDSVLLYDIYITAKGINAPVLYRRRNITITGEDLLNLESRGATVYVDQGDLARYRTSVEAQLSTIMARTDLPLQQRSSILYACSTNLVAEILKEPRAKGVLERSHALASTTAQFMKNESALSHLQQVASKDYYTYTHSVDVMVFSIALAVHLGYDQAEFLDAFGQGALLHDLGKSSIDQRIVNSPSALSETEWKVMREHPVLGCRILESLGRTEHVTQDIVRHHHERMNGKGYPEGLEGKGISRYARIVAIADVFDALSSKRVYKECWDCDAVWAEIAKLSGTKFDPELVECFLEIRPEIERIRERFPDAPEADAAD